MLEKEDLDKVLADGIKRYRELRCDSYSIEGNAYLDGYFRGVSDLANDLYSLLDDKYKQEAVGRTL